MLAVYRTSHYPSRGNRHDRTRRNPRSRSCRKGVARFFLTRARNGTISNSRVVLKPQRGDAELEPAPKRAQPAQAAQAPLVVLATPWTSVENALAALPSWCRENPRRRDERVQGFQTRDGRAVRHFGDRTIQRSRRLACPGRQRGQGLQPRPVHAAAALPSGEQPVLFVSGDDAAAKAGLRPEYEANNFAAIDLGDLATGSRLQQVGGPLGGLDLRLSAAG